MIGTYCECRNLPAIIFLDFKRSQWYALTQVLLLDLLAGQKLNLRNACLTFLRWVSPFLVGVRLRPSIQLCQGTNPMFSVVEQVVVYEDDAEDDTDDF